MNVETILNNPLPSNCYIVNKDNHVFIVDPGSKDCTNIITFVRSRNYLVDYIILTHEHFDHVWGADILRKEFNTSIICSKKCKEKLSIPQNYFNLFYFEDNSYFSIDEIDIVVNENYCIYWMNEVIKFILTPGHSRGSICFSVSDFLFTGDTVMKGFKPLILKRHEGSWAEFHESVQKIYSIYSSNMNVFPGHGDSFRLSDVSLKSLLYECDLKK